MTGLDGQRVYLDWNATAPLRPEARQAMLEAMDVVGNPSSVHAEGREAKKIVETARAQVARLVGCDPSEVVFTSGATEAIATVAAESKIPSSAGWRFVVGATEHDAVHQVSGNFCSVSECRVGPSGRHLIGDLELVLTSRGESDAPLLVALGGASGETGVVSQADNISDLLDPWENEHQLVGVRWLCDAVQLCGRVDPSFSWRPDYTVLSSHKLGGPIGSGCLALSQGRALVSMIAGGGQEQGRRSGTENVIGIAGFGAAAEAAQRDLEDGVWARVEKLRNILEERLESAVPDLILFGREVPRLPNTSCFAVPGWKGETQVMQMDLAGFAISAGSACSSGKVNKASRVLLAMGFDEETASSAIRVSMGPTTTEAEVMAFADTWTEHYRRRRSRAA